MTIRLRTMTEREYDGWRKGAEFNYAESLYQVGNVSREEAVEKAEKSFAMLLPDEFHTKEHVFYTILHETNPVGMFWVHVRASLAIPSAYIYEFEVDEKLRGQGIGRKALAALEPLMRESGAKSIALHVFAHNKVARGLYASSGYYETNINMRKDL